MWPLEDDRIEDQPAGLVRNDLAPVGLRRSGHRRLDDAEVLRAARVGHDDEAVAVMLDGVLVAVLARLDEHARRDRGRVGVDQVDFARLVVVGVDLVMNLADCVWPMPT